MPESSTSRASGAMCVPVQAHACGRERGRLLATHRVPSCPHLSSCRWTPHSTIVQLESDLLQTHVRWLPCAVAAHTNIMMYVCLFVCICMFVCMHMYVCMHACICMYVCMHACICMYVCMHAFIYAYIK